MNSEEFANQLEQIIRSSSIDGEFAISPEHESAPAPNTKIWVHCVEEGYLDVSKIVEGITALDASARRPTVHAQFREYKEVEIFGTCNGHQYTIFLCLTSRTVTDVELD